LQKICRQWSYFTDKNWLKNCEKTYVEAAEDIAVWVDGVPPRPPNAVPPSPDVPPRPKFDWAVDVVAVDVPKPKAGAAEDAAGAPNPRKPVEEEAGVDVP